MSLFSELSRRNVIRVGAAYIVAAWRFWGKMPWWKQLEDDPSYIASHFGGES